MSDGDKKTPEERLAAIEALMKERKETSKDWYQRMDTKLDKLLNNSKGMATVSGVKEAIKNHADSCAGRKATATANPGNSKPDESGKLDMVLKGYRGLGVVGSILVLNGMLVVVILKLTGVF